MAKIKKFKVAGYGRTYYDRQDAKIARMEADALNHIVDYVNGLYRQDVSSEQLKAAVAALGAAANEFGWAIAWSVRKPRGES